MSENYRDRAAERREGFILDIKMEPKGLDPALKQKLFETAQVKETVETLQTVNLPTQGKFTTHLGKNIAQYIKNKDIVPDFTTIKYNLHPNGEVSILRKKDSGIVSTGLSNDVIMSIGRAIRKEIPKQKQLAPIEDDVDNIFDDVDSNYVCEPQIREAKPIEKQIFSESRENLGSVETVEEDMFGDFDEGKPKIEALSDDEEEIINQDELIREEFQKDLSTLQGDDDLQGNADDYVECYPETLGMTKIRPEKRKYQGKEKSKGKRKK